MRILRPSNHARLWASICTHREQVKKRLDESWNAVLIMRPWAGKSVDGVASKLKAATKAMRAGALEPWEAVVEAPIDKSLDDGWAHGRTWRTRQAGKPLLTLLKSSKNTGNDVYPSAGEANEGEQA
jgi:hypothetical protein